MASHAAVFALLVCGLSGGMSPLTVRADDAAPVSLPPELKARCLALLREGLASDAFWPAMHAAEALSDDGLGAEVRERLWPRLPQENDAQRRCGLAREIVRSGDRRALPSLFAVLALEDTFGHTHAAESLYKIADVGDGVALRKLFATTPDSRRQLMAAASLARCGNLRALAFIRERTLSDQAESRKIAAWILARLGDSSDVPALLRARDQESDHVARAYQNHALAARWNRK